MLRTLTIIHRYNRTQTHRDKCRVTRQPSGGQIHLDKGQTGMMEGTGMEKKRIQIWVHWWSDDSKRESFDFFSVTPIHYWRLSLLMCSIMRVVVKVQTI